MGKARKFTPFDFMKEQSRQNKENAAIGRQNKAGVGSSFQSHPGNSPRDTGGGNNRDSKKLSLQGGIMRGPIAYENDTVIINASNQAILNTDGTIDQPVRGLIYLSDATSSTLDEMKPNRRLGDVIYLVNAGNAAITITHASTLAGQFLCPGSKDYSLGTQEVAIAVMNTLQSPIPTWNLFGGVAGSNEVFTWTANHDADGYNLILDQDGDSALINSRDATNGADDQLTIALGGLTRQDFNFSQGIFSVFDNATAEALQLTKTGTTATINSTDQLKLQIAGVDKLTLNESAGAVVIDDYTLNLVDTGSGEAATFHKDSAELLINSTDAYAFQIAGTDRINVNNLADGNVILTDLTLQLLDSGSGEAATFDKDASELLINTTDAYAFQIAGTDRINVNNAGDGNLIVTDLTLQLLDSGSGEAATLDKDASELLINSTDQITQAIAGVDKFYVASADIKTVVDILPTVDKTVNIGENSTPLRFLNAYIEDVREVLGIFFDDQLMNIQALNSGTDLVFTGLSGEDIIFREAAANFLLMNGTTNINAFARPVTLDEGDTISSDGVGEIGFFVGPVGTVGTEGTINSPYFESTTYPTNAATDADFGTLDGNIGVQHDTNAGGTQDARFCFRAGGVWYEVTGTKI